MPIYEYRCDDCGHTLEKMQKLADAPLTDCPECSHPALKKVISPVGFRLKGGGWYETDFKSGDNKKNLHESAKRDGDTKASGDKSAASAEAKSESKPKAETKSDSKPAGKSDSKPPAAAA